MFLKKSLLSMTALALLIFAGQASAQSISIMGTPSKVSGQGTEITVVVSQTGITQSVNAIQVEFDFDQSLFNACCTCRLVTTRSRHGFPVIY